MVLRIARTRWKHDRRVLDLLVGHLIEQMADAVQSGALLVHGLHDPPWRFRVVRAFKHRIFSLRVLLPASPGLDIHGTELPLFEWIADAHQESELLLVIGDGEPV